MKSTAEMKLIISNRKKQPIQLFIYTLKKLFSSWEIQLAVMMTLHLSDKRTPIERRCSIFIGHKTFLELKFKITSKTPFSTNIFS